jgi:predicted nucleic acid-binding protein
MNGLIAATAITHHLTVVARNTGDLERCQAKVFNPWKG